MSSPSARVRRASASLRRTSALWRSGTVGMEGSALVQDAWSAQHPAVVAPPTIVSRR